MSTLSPCRDYQPINSPPSIGFSLVANKLKNYLKIQITEIREPLIIGEALKDARQELIEIYKECSDNNWDGYGASPILNDSAYKALQFIELIPSSFPMPEIAPEPSGEIGLEWNTDNSSIFSISFSGKNSISYAGIFGSNKVHGTEYFDDTIPSVIIENIKRLYL